MDYLDHFLRIICALIAGTILGLERESHGRAAGLRTTLLVCMAATLAMILSEGFYFESVREVGEKGWHPDPARLAAGILTGIGFLGGERLFDRGASCMGSQQPLCFGL